MRILPAAVAAVFLLTPVLRAEEAILLDGRRLGGVMVLRAGSLQFQPPRGAAPLAMEQVRFVRFDSSSPPVVRFPLVHQVLLRDGQRLTGELLGLDEREVRIRSTWSAPLALPRAAVAAVVQAPALLPVFVDEFEDGLEAWAIAGSPQCDEREHASGRRSLLLDGTGQSATFALPHALEAGRVGVNFLGPPAGPDVRGHVDLVFQTPDGSQRIRLSLPAGAGDLARVELPNHVRWGTVAPRSAGWRRLVADFTPRDFRVLLDDLVLYASQRQGPEGPLREVRLVRDGNGAGELRFDDFQLARRVAVLPHPEGDAAQDELWLSSGDQLFGAIPRADRRSIEFEARFGKQTLSWAKVRGIWLRRQPFTALAPAREQVRIRLHPIYGFDPDQFDGVVRELDGKRLGLRHPLLGDLAVPRQWLRQVGGRPAK
jgi:hypothetical protein